MLASEYISKVHLINGHKYDIRIYVIIASVDPLRIYVYREGQARFASEKYSLAKTKIKDPFSHLTNYSVNKVNAPGNNNSQNTNNQNNNIVGQPYADDIIQSAQMNQNSKMLYLLIKFKIPSII